jgi:hypothetical protein
MLGGLLSGCGSSPEEEKPKGSVSDSRLAGRIQRVNRSAGFVLIRRYGFWRVSEGEIVESRGEGRTANLLPSGEKLGEHIAADIRSGDVEVGDAAYIRKILVPLTSEEVKLSKNTDTSEKEKINSDAVNP